MKPTTAFASKPPLAVFVACFSICAAGPLPAASPLETMDSEVSSVYQHSRDAVVRVNSQRILFLNGLTVLSQSQIGTGFFIDGKGRLLTAASVVGDARNCWIDWGNQRIPAKVLGTDPEVNLSLWQVDPEKCVGPGRPTPFLEQANSDDLNLGSLVIAVGFPGNLPSIPSVGFIGGFDINCGSHVFLTSHLRAGCRLSRGQSGSPLLNARGQVAGIAVATLGDDQCYALPINAAKKVVADILENGRALHGWVGLGVGEQTTFPAASSGSRRQVFIQQVFSNSPAAEAGFRECDVVLRISTNDIERTVDVLNTMFLHRCGEQIGFTIMRDGVTQEVRVIIGQRPPTEALARLPSPPVPVLQPMPPKLMIVPTSAVRP